MGNKPAIASRNLAAQLARFQEMPILCEDDPELDMGEADWHALAEHILRYGIAAHLAGRPELRVFSNLNFYYQPRFPSVYVSPDVMVVRPKARLAAHPSGYRLERDGPAPQFVAEVLSERTAEDNDLGLKLGIYAVLGVDEYLLVDLTGQFLPRPFILKRLQSDRTWRDDNDADGGVTSKLGFRVLVDTDEQLRVVNAVSGRRYVRPDEAEERLQKLEAELSRLKTAAKKPTRRRKKK